MNYVNPSDEVIMLGIGLVIIIGGMGIFFCVLWATERIKNFRKK